MAVAEKKRNNVRTRPKRNDETITVHPTYSVVKMRSSNIGQVSTEKQGFFRSFSVILSPISVLLCFSLCAPGTAKPIGRLTLVAPLYVTNAEFMSVVTITNATQNPVSVLASFNSLEGEEVGRKLINVSQHSDASIDVDSVEMTERRFPALGSISLSATPASVGGITSHLTIASRRRAGRISVEENLQTVDDNLRPLRAAFISAALSAPVLAVHSLSELPQRVSINCSDAEGRTYQSQISLPPRMTFLVNACISRESEGRTYEQLLRGDTPEWAKGAMNIQIKSGGPEGSIAVWGFARAGQTIGATLQIIGIEFVEWNPPIEVLLP